ncbi:MAG: hypothetical protein JWM71_195, partial [Solirubrobacteraceae bacterium]|nr:hypothetical protein [Solirubrobacteraceae bacterium]
MISDDLRAELAELLGPDGLLSGDAPGYDRDATESRGLHGVPDAVALPDSAEQVGELGAQVVADHGLHGGVFLVEGLLERGLGSHRTWARHGRAGQGDVVESRQSVAPHRSPAAAQP